MRLAILADLHFGPPNLRLPERRGELADLLLLRTVHRLNRFIRPDAVLCLGDLLDDGAAHDAAQRLGQLKKILALLKMPWLALPGNHDGDAARFYEIFGQPLPWLEVAGARLVPFVDREQPGYNYERRPADLDRLRAARLGFAGPLIVCQHGPLFPPGRLDCPYNFTNAEAAIAAMVESGAGLTIGGHYHRGEPLLRAEGCEFLVAPALCESPFTFLEVTVGDGTATVDAADAVQSGDQRHAHDPARTVTVTPHELALPAALELVDYHIHTAYAYCNENMALPGIRQAADAFRLAAYGISEHSGHLYFSHDDYRSNRYFRAGLAAARPEDGRLDSYLREIAASPDRPRWLGLEVDCDVHGAPLLRPGDAARVDYLIGSLHRLAEFLKPEPDLDLACQEYLALLERFLANCPMQILAHPLRVFRRNYHDAPPQLFVPVADLLRRHQVAAEVNYHTNRPPVDFVRTCLERGVKLAFGSDSHNLYEVGEFAPHLALLHQAGYHADPREVLFDLRRARRSSL